MVYCLSDFTPRAIDAFDLVSNVAIIVLFRQLGGCAIRRASDLTRQFEPFVPRPIVRNFADVDV
jgi:hypothetical protein